MANPRCRSLAQEAVGAGEYLVGRSKGGEYTVRGAGVRGRKARCVPGRAGAAIVAAREPIIGVGARVAWVLEAGALGRRPSCGRRGSMGTDVAGAEAALSCRESGDRLHASCERPPEASA